MVVDSRQLFIKAKFLLSNVKYVDGFQYVGLETGLDERFAKILSSCIDTDQIVLIRGRRDSAVVTQREIRESLRDELYKVDFDVWDLSFSTVVVFNKIGVYRIGRID